MMPVKEMGLAVIGDAELVSGMRLAGISRYILVDASQREARETARNAVRTLTSENVAIIIIQEDFMPLIQDIIREMREEKRLFPIFVEVPGKRGARVDEVIANYRSFIRRFIGFDIQI